MNIAICLFGVGFDYKDIRHLLYPTSNNYYLFAHTYGEFNSDGFVSTIVDSPYVLENNEYHNDLNVNNIPIGLTETNAVHNRPGKYTDITNSMMKVNTLKKEYELQHDMVFDIVVNVKAGIDYHQYNLFNSIANIDIDNYSTSVFGEYMVGYSDYNTPRFNTDFCFGSSLVMDIINNFHRYYNNGILYQILKSDYYDNAYKNMHYKALVWKWLAIKNIMPMNIIGDY
jgi:hypothetical protein